MTDTTFAVSPEVPPGKRMPDVDWRKELRIAFRRPVEAYWSPKSSLIACDSDHALLKAFHLAFYDHLPLRLSPDAIWITLARGFALHVNEHAEELRHRFVSHEGREKLVVERQDFLPGAANPWPEVFEAFDGALDEATGDMASFLHADFSTTGPTERAVSHLMAMETLKSYFEYELRGGCGIPSVTLTGTLEDWQSLRVRARRFADFGIENWIEALDPVLSHFEQAKKGNADVDFWKSLFRYNSGSGPAVLTGWASVLFPYLQDGWGKLSPNPCLADWRERLAIDDAQHWRERWQNPQGVGIRAFPPCVTSVPMKTKWGAVETEMRLVGGLLGVTQNDDTLAVEPECGWLVLYEEPVDPLSQNYAWLESRTPPTE